MEAYRGTPTDDNADCADLEKSNAQVINGQFLSYNKARLERVEQNESRQHNRQQERTIRRGRNLMKMQ